tara:strand:+ start:1145 stop:2053 length:909 start_codon:yes stop_codon:yes gene_type:complete
MNLFSIIKEEKPDISDNSIKTYIASIKNINKNINENKPIENFDFLLNQDNVFKFVNTKTYLTKRNLLNAVIVVLKTITSEPDEVKSYVIERDKGNLQYEEHTATHEKSEKEAANWISYDEIITIKDKLNLKSEIAQKLFLTLFIDNVVRNDFRALYKITDRALKQLNKKYKLENIEPPKINYFVKYKSNYYILLNQFKTSKRLDPIKIEISQTHTKLINKYLRQTKFNKYLFENPKTRTSFTTAEFTLWIEEIFKSTGKKIGTTLLRHIIISHKHGDHLAAQEEDARKAGHGVLMQSKYVKR